MGHSAAVPRFLYAKRLRPRVPVAQVFGKFNIAGALREQGINPATIAEGRNADAQFPFSDYSRQQLAQVNHLVDHIYLGFIQKVPAGMVHMSCSSVRMQPHPLLMRTCCLHRACSDANEQNLTTLEFSSL